ASLGHRPYPSTPLHLAPPQPCLPGGDGRGLSRRVHSEWAEQSAVADGPRDLRFLRLKRFLLREAAAGPVFVGAREGMAMQEASRSEADLAMKCDSAFLFTRRDDANSQVLCECAFGHRGV